MKRIEISLTLDLNILITLTVPRNLVWICDGTAQYVMWEYSLIEWDRFLFSSAHNDRKKPSQTYIKETVHFKTEIAIKVET